MIVAGETLEAFGGLIEHSGGDGTVGASLGFLSVPPVLVLLRPVSTAVSHTTFRNLL